MKPFMSLKSRPAAAWVALFLCSSAFADPTGREGVDVGRPSAAVRNPIINKVLPAERLEAQAAQQYRQMLQQAAQQRALGPDTHPQVVRLRSIAARIIPYALAWNPRAGQWNWEINLIGSKQINAFCMPGGKIAFYTGIIDQLQLTDDEIAMVMGHEIAHALRDHSRERMAKGLGTSLVAGGISAYFGLGQTGQTVVNGANQLLNLTFSREDESEADLIGIELAARAGFNPRAGVTLWQKMSAASKGAPPQFLSTHPSGKTRIQDIEDNLPKVMPLYERTKAARGN